VIKWCLPDDRSSFISSMLAFHSYHVLPTQVKHLLEKRPAASVSIVHCERWALNINFMRVGKDAFCVVLSRIFRIGATRRSVAVS